MFNPIKSLAILLSVATSSLRRSHSDDVSNAKIKIKSDLGTGCTVVKTDQEGNDKFEMNLRTDTDGYLYHFEVYHVPEEYCYRFDKRFDKVMVLVGDMSVIGLKENKEKDWERVLQFIPRRLKKHARNIRAE